jgi:hypothetical protein
MEKSLYQKQQQNVMEYIPYGSFLYHVLQGLPLILWLIFLYNFKSIPNSITTLLGKQDNSLIIFYTTAILPFIIYFYSLFVAINASNPIDKVANATSASMPDGWDYCFASKVSNENINKGILGFLDQHCIQNNETLFRRKIIDMLNRYHYLNYILLLLIITFKWHAEYIKVKFTKIQCLVIGFSILLGVLATIITLFSSYLIRGMWIVQTVSVMLTMNISCFILTIISFLKDFI